MTPAIEHTKVTEDDSAVTCLVMLARLHGIAADGTQIRHELAATATRRADVADLLIAARRMGLEAKHVRVSSDRLTQTPLPAIGITTDDAGERSFYVLARVDGDRALIHAPSAGHPEICSIERLTHDDKLELLLFRSIASATNDLRRFDFTWFIPAIVKYRRLLGEVLLVSFVLQLFALVTPLFFQVVMDKVLLHRAFTTLDVVGVGLLVVVIFEVLLGYLRTYVFAHTTSRIDVELGSRLFRHLLNLPIAYFLARRVGDSVARVRELENIRAFLTGNAITVVLDLAFAVVFIVVMLTYSKVLTLIVVLSIPAYAILTATITPILRERLAERFNRGAENQAFLVETIAGIDTVKSTSVEPHWYQRWDNQLAGYVAASFRTANLSAIASAGVTLISKLVTVATMYVGAKLVIEGQLSVGQLIAFNMLAGQVAQPVMRLAQLWTDFQQTGVSIQRLGDILNTHPETIANRQPIPPLKGRIEFIGVTFRYRPDGAVAIDDLSLSIAAGEVVGIVGRSGSGKSTIARLVQRLYVAERGRIQIDGFDLALVDASSVRRQIGVVAQENLLFSRTIRENIALTDPGASLDRVVAAAELAGAHEFILELPEGYDTIVGEHGSSLSGGQRQRIAIARALMTDPRILVFDEATSALDYESENVIQRNMQTICAGRTVLVIAHRLSALRNVDRVVVLDGGTIVESGSPAELLALPESYFARLHRLQQG